MINVEKLKIMLKHYDISFRYADYETFYHDNDVWLLTIRLLKSDKVISMSDRGIRERLDGGICFEGWNAQEEQDLRGYLMKHFDEWWG